MITLNEFFDKPNGVDSVVLQRVLSSIDPYQFLEYYGAKNITPSSDGKELLHSCILDSVIPHHKGGDQSPSASLNTETLLWNCFSYGGGTLLWLTSQLESCSEEEALLKLSSFSVKEREKGLVDTLREVMSSTNSSGEQLPVYSPKVLDSWEDGYCDYVRGRGVSCEVASQFHVRYDKENDAVVLPHFWRGQLVGWQKRQLSSFPKYKNTTSFPKHETLYGQIVGGDLVVVVESVFSVLKAETYRPSLPDGHPWREASFLSTFGAKASPVQAELLRQFDRVVLFFDGDQAGYRGTLQMLSDLGPEQDVWVVDWTETPLDLADLDFEQFSGLCQLEVPSFLMIPKLEELLQ